MGPGPLASGGTHLPLAAAGGPGPLPTCPLAQASRRLPANEVAERMDKTAPQPDAVISIAVRDPKGM